MNWNIALILAFIAFLIWRKWSTRRSPELLAAIDARLKRGAALIDVRTPREFAQFHLPSARNLPLHELHQRATELKKEKAGLVLYCNSGARSARALMILKGMGFKEVDDLGSFRNWTRLRFGKEAQA
ncbi:rhodanese-like domain-containing protein [Myxococcota bacterium]|nr:rhodanese-like domain-containing protein [Myxococcota bacterium]MBU1430874.1 rhodanese-like domain-containing protein [Myxococcota bacterium]MBU1899914.1 rhodanese-like domain-containing protein [Myxococcota bacterium]